MAMRGIVGQKTLIRSFGRAFAVTLIPVLLSACTRGCGSGPTTTQKSAPVLKIHLSSEPVSLDPTLAEDGVSLKVLGNVMEGMVGYDGGGKLVNHLAESYSVSQDGRRYEFSLKPGLTWSDGKPLQILDFITGMRRALDPKTGSKLAGSLFPVRGAKNFHDGKGKWEDVAIREESGKLVVELESPAPYFLQVFTLSVCQPLRADVLASNGGKWPETSPVTGPYRIVSHQNEQKIRLERNPNYWGWAQSSGQPAAQPKSPEVVEFMVIPDENTALNLFEHNQIDILGRVPSLDLPRLRNQGVIHTDPFLATYYIAFNTRKPPFNDRHWRRAVAGSLDRKGIVSALDTGELPARSWIPVGLDGYYNYEDPRSLFTDSVTLVKKGPLPKEPVSAQFDTSGRNTMIMEKIQADIQKTTGLKVSLVNMDWKTHVKTLQTDPASIYRFGWLAPFMDPITHLQVFMSDSPNNYTGWKNAEYDQLVREIAALPPGGDRSSKISTAQALLVDREAVVVPIYHYVQNHAVSRRVAGFRVNPTGVIRFDELTFQ